MILFRLLQCIDEFVYAKISFHCFITCLIGRKTILTTRQFVSVSTDQTNMHCPLTWFDYDIGY